MSIVYDLAGDLVRTIYDRRISTPSVLDIDDHFPAARNFVAEWQTLRDEALVVARDLSSVPRFHEMLPEQKDIAAKDGRDWRMFVLKAYGLPMVDNLAKCPQITRLISQSPDVLSAALSFLAPGKHIPRHRGPFRGVVRFHLGLSMPVDGNGVPQAVLAIDDHEHLIGDGECLLWDDTYPHEVWNRSDRVRIALLMDVRRRGMPLDMAVLSRVLIGAIGTTLRFHHMVRKDRALVG